MLSGSIHTVEKNIEALEVAKKNIGLEVNVDQVKWAYKFKSWDQHAGQNHNIKLGNKSFERVEYFKYLETRLTDESFIHEQIMSIFKSRNA